MTRVPEHVIDPLIRQEFGVFLRFAFEELSGGRRYMHNWHIDAIIHQLDLVAAGENRRLIVTMPPRHLKSVTISVAWVAWMLGKNPGLRFMCASYGALIADQFARDCLRLIDSSWYRRAFPSLKIARRAVSDFKTSANGGRLSTSVDGIGTGFGADYVIIDDPMKANFATSQIERDTAKLWFDNTLRSRLESQGTGSFIIVAQRLHEDDLPGALIRDGGWNEFRLPAIATHDELIPLTGGRFYQRREGYALHEARLSLAALKALRAENPMVFEPQWQQAPIASIGPFVQRAWFKYYDDPPRSGVIIQSWDTASKTGVRNAWSVGITALLYQGRYYILDVYRKRVEFSELQRAICESCKMYSVDRLLIEDASSGEAMIQQLCEDPPDGVPRPIAVRPTVDKITRYEAQASKIESGSVVLPRAAPWLTDFLHEVTNFPNARFADQADALAQLLANPPFRRDPIINVGPEIIEEGSQIEAYEDADIDGWF
ncbi:phage terminase large subunit [Sphingomonas sp. GB1N7]